MRVRIVCSIAATIALGICLGLTDIGIYREQVAALENTAQVPASAPSPPAIAQTAADPIANPAVAPPKLANLDEQPGSKNTQQIAAAENIAEASTPAPSFSRHSAAIAPIKVGTQPAVAPHPKWANFEGEARSKDAREVADWVTDSRDNRGMPFVIIDKVDAKVFVFDALGRLRGAAPVLLGLAQGDYAVPGIGDRKMSNMRPEERITPAGRFVASLGYNAKKTDVLWVDYKDAISLHRVLTNNPKERRLERLNTPTPLDNRISFGCINVPANFFDQVVKPAFKGTYGIVYVLPETISLSQAFKSFYDVETRWAKAGNPNLTSVQSPVSGSRSQFRRP